MLDLIIRNGLVVDGTGSPGFHAAVLVHGDSITVHRGDSSAFEAARSIDAAGMVVAPGFIDMHSHGGLTILGSPRQEASVHQGITTEVYGVDGISHAPFKTAQELSRYMWQDSGINGYPPLPAKWLSQAELLDQYDGKVSLNAAYLAGNSPLRIWGVGWANTPATPAQIENMKSALREAMEDGAWGLSTGLDYPPGAYGDTAELAALAEVSAKLGGFYHTHTRKSLGVKGVMGPSEEAIEIGRRSGSAVHLTHYRQAQQGKGSHHQWIDLVENGRNEGLDVTFDVYPYEYSQGMVAQWFPFWMRERGPEGILEAIKDGKVRDRLKREIDEADFRDKWVTGFNKPHNKHYEGMQHLEIARIRGEHPVDTLCNLLIEEDLFLTAVGRGTNPHTLAAFVAHPYGMIASDAIHFGEFPSPRTFGTFAIVLSEYVREERQLTLEQAVRKMSSFPAQRLGLPDRGILRNGFKADIVVFNPKTVKANTTREKPRQLATGVEYVLVNGKVVVDRGVHSGATPGRALRRGKRD